MSTSSKLTEKLWCYPWAETSLDARMFWGYAFEVAMFGVRSIHPALLARLYKLQRLDISLACRDLLEIKWADHLRGEVISLTTAVVPCLGLRYRKMRFPPPHEDEGYVYFVRRHIDGLVKIGHSQNPKRRFNQLRCDSAALDVLGIVSTASRRQLERMLHLCCHKQRAFGEWFHLSALEVDELITAAQWRIAKAGVLASE